jgi:hypothetical protein
VSVERRRAAAPDEAMRSLPGGVAGASREILGRALSWLAVADVSPHLELELMKLATSIRSFGERPPEPGGLLALGSRWPAGASEEPEESAAAAWSRYAHGRKAELSASGLVLLREGLAQAAADPERALADGRLIQYRLQEVLDDSGIAPHKAAGFLLDDLRDSLIAESSKRLAGRAPSRRIGGHLQAGAAALTKSLPSTVFNDMEGEVTPLAKMVTRLRGEIPGKWMGKHASPSEHEMLDTLSKLDGAAAIDVGKGDAGLTEAREVVRLLERLIELARRYTVDLVGVLEHYLDSARRIVSDAQDLQARRQLANDRQAIERTLAGLDPQEVARGVAALPLYLLRLGGAGEDAFDTALLPQLGNERLTRSYARLCLRLLEPDPHRLQPPAADGPPGTESADNDL